MTMNNNNNKATAEKLNKMLEEMDDETLRQIHTIIGAMWAVMLLAAVTALALAAEAIVIVASHPLSFLSCVLRPVVALGLWSSILKLRHVTQESCPGLAYDATILAMLAMYTQFLAQQDWFYLPSFITPATFTNIVCFGIIIGTLLRRAANFYKEVQFLWKLADCAPILLPNNNHNINHNHSK